MTGYVSVTAQAFLVMRTIRELLPGGSFVIGARLGSEKAVPWSSFSLLFCLHSTILVFSSMLRLDLSQTTSLGRLAGLNFSRYGEFNVQNHDWDCASGFSVIHWWGCLQPSTLCYHIKGTYNHQASWLIIP